MTEQNPQIVGSNAPESVKRQAREAQERAEELRKKAAASKPAVGEESPAQTQPPPEDAPPPAADDAQDELTRARRERDELKERLRKTSGTLGGQMQQLRSQIADQQLVITRLETELRNAQTQPPTATPAAGRKSIGDLHEQDLLDRYGTALFEALDVQIAERLKEALSGSQEVDQKIEGLRREISGSVFWSQVEALAPGALAVNGGPEGKDNPDPQWTVFLAEPVAENAKRTWREEAQDAIARGDSVYMAQIVATYQRQNSDVEPKKRTADPNRTREDVVPRSVGRAPASAAPRNTRRVPMSEVRAWQDKCAHARPGAVGNAVLATKTAEYQQALREGRVDFDR